jgi:hypothetical protein
MHEAIFTLRQETPIIHFLHDQPGATLRATELKPKLDKFILGNFKTINPVAADDFEEAIRKLKQVVKEGKPSAYQIRIVPPKTTPQFSYFESRFTRNEESYLPNLLKDKFKHSDLQIIQPSPFFANNDKRKDGEKGKEEKWEEIRLGVFYQGEFKVHVKTWDSNLLELIQKALPLLFCVENFGMRQSKGFGCFRETSVSSEDFHQVLRKSFVFSKKKSLPNSPAVVFKTIDDVYKVLRNKAGANNNNPNEPSEASAIRDYFEEQDSPIEWEKWLITNKLVFDDDYSSDHEVRFVRALLGLPGLHDYPQTREKVKVQIADNSANEKVERYRSPIMFKVFNGWLYLVARDVDAHMLGREFVFFVGENKDTNPRKTRLATPKKFQIEDFLTKKLNNWQNV